VSKRVVTKQKTIDIINNLEILYIEELLRNRCNIQKEKEKLNNITKIDKRNLKFKRDRKKFIKQNNISILDNII